MTSYHRLLIFVPLILTQVLVACSVPSVATPAPTAQVAVATSAVTAVPSNTSVPTQTVVPATSTPVPTVTTTPTPAATLTPSPVPTAKPTETAVPSDPSPTATRADGATAQVSRLHSADLRRAQLTDLDVTGEDGLRLAGAGTGRFVSSGGVVSPIVGASLPFNDLVLSWDATSPAGTSLDFEVRVRSGGEWSEWYAMGTWRNGAGASVPGQNDTLGTVDVDTLKVRRPADAWQIRVALATSDPAATPSLRSLSVAVADRNRAPTGPKVSLPSGWARDLAVPTESQAIQEPAVAWSICSPTSLYMVLRYWGVDTTLPTVYRGVRDRVNGEGSGIFGNWPLNTGYAAERGFDAYVARFYSLDQVRAEIAAGRPVPVSIRYDNGELPGAPLDSTSGHLIVVRGFTENGEVIVNDPAAPNRSSVRRVLKAADLEKVWLRSGGIAYMIAPRQ